MKIKLKTDAYSVISAALDSAIESALNKSDKWCDDALTTGQRQIIASQLPNYFWANIEEAGHTVS